MIVIEEVDTLQQAHNDWKRKGFPVYPTEQSWRNNIFNQLVNFKNLHNLNINLLVVPDSWFGVIPKRGLLFIHVCNNMYNDFGYLIV